MPEKVEEKIRESVKNAHPNYDNERVDKEVFSIMNKQGLLQKKHHKRGRRRHES